MIEAKRKCARQPVHANVHNNSIGTSGDTKAASWPEQELSEVHSVPRNNLKLGRSESYDSE